MPKFDALFVSYNIARKHSSSLLEILICLAEKSRKFVSRRICTRKFTFIKQNTHYTFTMTSFSPTEALRD